MFKLAAAGLAIFVAGAIKSTLHLGRQPSLEDYLAFRCGGAGLSESVLLNHSVLSWAHCWGCYAMAAGAALLALALLQRVLERRATADSRS